MRSNLLCILVILLAAGASLHAVYAVDENEYILKAGDLILFQVMSADTISIESPVLPEGRVSIYPFGDPIPVAGKTLHEGRRLITDAVHQKLPNSLITAELLLIAPMHIHVTGAVILPGEYITEEVITLYQALELAEGLLPSASRRVKLHRNGAVREYDLRKYLANGDLSQNPVLFHDDLVQVGFVESAATVFVNNDTLNTIESVELQQDETLAMKDLLGGLSRKTPWAEYGEPHVVRDGQLYDADESFLVTAGDSVFVSLNPGFIYINGNVAKAGRYPYNAGSDLDYYLGLAGGLINSTKRHDIYVITPEGKRKKFDRETLRPGDTIYAAEFFLWKLSRYLGFITSITMIVYYLYINNDKV